MKYANTISQFWKDKWEVLFTSPLAPDGDVKGLVSLFDKWEVVFLDPLAPDRNDDPIKKWLVKKLKPRIGGKRSLSITVLSDVMIEFSLFCEMNPSGDVNNVVLRQVRFRCDREEQRTISQQTENPTVEIKFPNTPSIRPILGGSPFMDNAACRVAK
jgi:hypothetical protein